MTAFNFQYDPEATIQDADIWMAYENSRFRLRKKAEEQGVCFHTSGIGLSDSGQIFYPEQELLTGEQVICTDTCKRIFETWDELMEDQREKYLYWTGAY